MRAHNLSELTLIQLLGDVLFIARTPELASLDGPKTSALASWMFSTIKLPSKVLLSKRDAILSWMRDMVESAPRTGNPKVWYLAG